MKPPPQTLNDITTGDLFPLHPTFPIKECSAGLVLGFLLLGFLLWLRNWKRDQSPSLNPYEKALNQLEVVERQTQKNIPNDIASTLSLLVRNSMTMASPSQSLYQSREEFIASNTTRLLPVSCRSQTSSLLALLWKIEYKNMDHTPETVETLIEETRQTLHKLSAHHTPSSKS